jgi:hypothetical protein
MKKLISLVAILSLFSTFALSGIKNIKIDGSLDAVSINLDNSTDLTKTDTNTGANDDLINQTKARLMLGLSTDLTDKVSGKILVYKNDRLWGTPVDQDIVWILNVVRVANAYVTLKDVVLNGLELTVGRQFVGDPKDLLLYFGPLSDYNLNILALDALKAEYNTELLSVGLVSGKLLESSVLAPPLTGNHDIDILALDLTTEKIVPEGKVALRFVNEVVNDPVSDNVNNLQILGLDLKGVIPVVEGLNYKLLYAMNLGQEQKDVKYKGTGLVLGAGYDKELEVGKVNVKAEYASGSGDDSTTADDEDFVSLGSDYRYGEVYGKGLNVGANVGGAGITNQTIIVLEAGFAPSAILDGKLGLGLGYYMFSKTKVASGEDSNIGNEIDVKVKYDLTKDVGLGLTYGIFTPGKALESTGKDAANVLAMNLNVKF